MESIVDILISYGYWGMLISAFVAGSIFPFSSEAIMVGLIAAGLNPTKLVVYATIGNWGGSMFNYSVGRIGNIEWIEKYLRVDEKKINKTKQFMKGKGAWMGLLTFLPILGSAISIVLGLMRANFFITSLSTFIGKAARYFVLMLSTNLFV